MTVQNLYLEITRACTLKCEHCLRGENRNEYMSLKTLNNIFKDIKKIDRLLLTGGEPLLAISQLEEIIRLIKENSIKINSILIITNGTVLNDRVIKVLKELSSLSNLIIKVSYDVFHLIELNRLNLHDKRKSNYLVLKELFNAEDYGVIDNARHKALIIKRGRAAQLTKERLNQINEQYSVENDVDMSLSYLPEYSFDAEYDIDNDIMNGTISTDVNGNIVAYGLSFDEENEEQEKYCANIGELGLKKAILNYIKFYVIYSEEKQKENESSLFKLLMEKK